VGALHPRRLRPRRRGGGNTILENTGPDVPKVYGAGSPEAAEAAATPALAQTDFVGIGVHCAIGSAVCAAGNARPDLLPDEPGGYDGYDGLFGAKYVNPVISSNGPATTVDHSAPMTDPAGNPCFPGFDWMSAANMLGYTAHALAAFVFSRFRWRASAPTSVVCGSDPLRKFFQPRHVV
jgi:hypothetical protein